MSSESGERSTQINHRLQVKTSKQFQTNSSRDFHVRGQTVIDFFTVIMNYGIFSTTSAHLNSFAHFFFTRVIIVNMML